MARKYACVACKHMIATAHNAHAKKLFKTHLSYSKPWAPVIFVRLRSQFLK